MTTKITIPSSCKIGHMMYDIRWNDRLLKKLDSRAHISSEEQKLLLSHRRLDQSEVDLLHEILHGLTHEFDIDIEDPKIERFMSSLAHGLCIALQSLGIELDFTGIPEDKH